VKSKLADRRVLRRPGIFSQRNPRNTTQILERTYNENRDLRFSTPTESATLRPGPPATSRHPFPPQLSPLSDSHIAPGYHPFGLLRMSKNTQQRALSSFRKNEIRLRNNGGVRVVKQDSKGPSRPVRLTDNRRMGDTCRATWSFAFCTVLFESENSQCGSSRCCCLLL
jgi:hypothetical protein